MSQFYSRLLASAVLAALTVAVPAIAQPGVGGTTTTTTVFSSGGGFQLPEQIIAAPAGFGGGYLVVDAYASDVFQIAPNGGTPTVFAPTGLSNTVAIAPLGSYYGSLSGDVLVAGIANGGGSGAAAVNSSGQVANLFSTATSNLGAGQFSGSAVATQAFGSIAAGQVALTGANGTVDILAANGQSYTTFATVPGSGGLFGVAFDKGQLFVDSANNGNLYAINSQGQATLLTTLPVVVGANNGGGRQIAVAPTGYGSYGGDLFVSVSGSTAGGGSLGTIYVVDPTTGALVATFDQGSAASPLDPRGLLFTTIDGQEELLASNGDPEIDTISPQSFTASAPEIDAATTGSAVTLLLGAVIVVAARRRGT